MRKYFFSSNFVCHIQQLDSDRVIEYLNLNKWQRVELVGDAELILYNTCAFRQNKIESAVEGIRQLNLQKKPDSKMIVLGCLPAIADKRLREVFDGKTISPTNLVSLDQELNSSISFSKISSAKLMDLSEIKGNSSEISTFMIRTNYGCGHTCSYCGIRKAFPKIKSKTIPEILGEIENAVQAGVIEVGLTSEDLTAYGKDTSDRSLVKLLDSISELNLQCKITLPRLHPDYLIENEDRFLKFIEKNNISLLGIAINSAAPNVLRLMNRSYDPNRLQELLVKIKKIKPKVVIRSDWIIGHPGETDDDFNDSVKFFMSAPIDIVSPFRFSLIEGTPAEKLSGHLSDPEIDKRMQMVDKVFSVMKGPKS